MVSTIPSHNNTILHATANSCKTKYPLIFVHGLGLRDKGFFIKYWGKIPHALRNCGAQVFTGGQNAFNTHKRNALLLKKNILTILKNTGTSKINIIAHSKGGIESRYLISKLGMNSKIASLTTIATPHRGSYMANIMIYKLPGTNLLKNALNLYGKSVGDISPNSIGAGMQLTTFYMKKFNKQVPNSRDVYYQSFCSRIEKKYKNIIWLNMYSLLYKYEGPNDGLVSVSSCKWGNFRGVVRTKNYTGISHTDIIGLKTFSGVDTFDAYKFYIFIAKDLKKRGF